AGHSHCHGANETELTATLADPTGVSSATGSVTFKSNENNGTTDTQFTVTVQGASPSTTLDVSVDSTVVGQITTDASGDGTLALASNSDGPTTQPLPTDFPTVTAGTVVTLGPLTGTLAAADSPEKYPEHQPATVTRLTANLADPTGVDATTGTAK